MVGKHLKLIFAATLAISLATPAFAQPAPPAGDATRATHAGPRKQLATIIFAGLGGAVLGLSTLSFYGRPQDKLSNIAIGFAFGVISGTAYVTYGAATNPQEFYGQKPWIEFENAQMHAQLEKSRAPKTLQIGLTF